MRGCAFSRLLIAAGRCATVGGTMVALERAYGLRLTDVVVALVCTAAAAGLVASFASRLPGA